MSTRDACDHRDEKALIMVIRRLQHERNRVWMAVMQVLEQVDMKIATKWMGSCISLRAAGVVSYSEQFDRAGATIKIPSSDANLDANQFSSSVSVCENLTAVFPN